MPCVPRSRMGQGEGPGEKGQGVTWLPVAGNREDMAEGKVGFNVCDKARIQWWLNSWQQFINHWSVSDKENCVLKLFLHKAFAINSL